MSSNPVEQPPHFQDLQQQFADSIRNPEQVAYAPAGEEPIEQRRLRIYQQLFFNNIEGFFSQIFPVCADILGQERWLQIIREYMVKHRSRTPLFHELGEEFLDFLEAEFTPQKSDPDFLLELAHYEWIELALSISTEIGFEIVDLQQADLNKVDLEKAYELSPVAWPLAYEWPVHQLSKAFRPTAKPTQTTTLLAYRHEQTNGDEVIDFMSLTPLLYQFLMVLETSDSAQSAFATVTDSYNFTTEQRHSFALPVLQELVDLNILRAVI
jgi:hypothetical protein